MSTSTLHHPALLALEDGRIFHGYSFGYRGSSTGEICFNTAMSGYQEILTDPSYRGQIVSMTYPLIGNYGISDHDAESASPQVAGFVIEEFSRLESNWNSRQGLPVYLKMHGIPAIAGIDTRSLTRHLRSQGTMRACISMDTNNETAVIARAQESPLLHEPNLVEVVSTKTPYEWDPDCREIFNCRPLHSQRSLNQDPLIVLYDFGVKRNILRLLRSYRLRVMVLPADTSAEAALAFHPKGIFLSNGPGDPATMKSAHTTARKLAETKPVFGICLGHQILAIAFGAKTFKLKFGHRGANHPVQDLRSGRVFMTSQNHGYAVEEHSLPSDLEITHRHLNDVTVAGIRHRTKKVSAVQFHPEGSPGPHDVTHFFEEFVAAISSEHSNDFKPC